MGVGEGVLYVHSFKTHFLAPLSSYINRPTAHVKYVAVILPKGKQFAFTQASLLNLSGIHVILKRLC